MGQITINQGLNLEVIVACIARLHKEKHILLNCFIPGSEFILT